MKEVAKYLVSVWGGGEGGGFEERLRERTKVELTFENCDQVSASAGLETLRRIYTGDLHTQNILRQTVQELALTAKMSQSYLARRNGETSRLVT